MSSLQRRHQILPECIILLKKKFNLLKNFKPIDWGETHKYFLLSKREFNYKTNYIFNDWVFIGKKNKEITRYPHKLRMYSKNELKDLFGECGLQKVKVFGGFEGEKFFKLKSPTMIIIGEKAQHLVSGNTFDFYINNCVKLQRSHHLQHHIVPCYS